MDLHCQLLVIAFMLPSAPGDLKSNSSSPENSTFSSLDAAANFTNQMRAANVTSRGQPGELHPFEYDYETLRLCGLVTAAVIAVVGLLLLIDDSKLTQCWCVLCATMATMK
ncbi:uncharacterized protein LOC120540746 isoform X2 [Polypterus senegalus]|uniref:uncharacterized protein LOC120540746 isoform X2 n=1 Tax=Polypterus senegalus TaxID=55291 RepID=UPI00196500EB|nr:uncharacterized protein LOC120540746 isoform X2 [Polypterus senegalus]